MHKSRISTMQVTMCVGSMCSSTQEKRQDQIHQNVASSHLWLVRLHTIFIYNFSHFLQHICIFFIMKIIDKQNKWFSNHPTITSYCKKYKKSLQKAINNLNVEEQVDHLGQAQHVHRVPRNCLNGQRENFMC